MSCGKYSPTLVRVTPDDFNRIFGVKNLYDDLGYDNYGYHKDTNLDRAGYSENNYMDDDDLYDRVSQNYMNKPKFY